MLKCITNLAEMQLHASRTEVQRKAHWPGAYDGRTARRAPLADASPAPATV